MDKKETRAIFIVGVMMLSVLGFIAAHGILVTQNVLDIQHACFSAGGKWESVICNYGDEVFVCVKDGKLVQLEKK